MPVLLRRHLLGVLLAAMLPMAAMAADPPAPRKAEAFSLDALRGQVVYLDFWASWCGPCKQSFPWMADLHQRLADKGLRIVAVSVDRSEAAALRFLTRQPPPFEVVLDPKGVLASQYDLNGMPNSFLFDREGKLVMSHVGFVPADADILEKRILEVLAP